MFLGSTQRRTIIGNKPHQTITQLANAAAEKLSTFENSFRHLHTPLIFRAGKNDRPLLIRLRKFVHRTAHHSHSRSRVHFLSSIVQSQGDQSCRRNRYTCRRLYIAGFKKVAQAEKERCVNESTKAGGGREPSSANDATEKIEKLKEEVIALVDERIAQPLRDRGANVRIYKNLFDNARQKGWRLGKRRRTRIYRRMAR